MRDRLNGIEEKKIDRLVLDIVDYTEKINSTLNQIDDVMSTIKDYYVCENATMFEKKFTTLRDNFAIVQKNLLSYSTDLVKVKACYNQRQVEVISALKN